MPATANEGAPRDTTDPAPKPARAPSRMPVGEAARQPVPEPAPDPAPGGAHGDVVGAAIALHARRPGGLLPLLHEIQDRAGFVPPDAVPRIAKAMHLSIAEVHGVISFYHHFRATPPGRHVVRVCVAEACQSMGANALMAHARASLGIDLHDTTPDGALTLEPVYCLGNCACSPAVLVDNDLVGRVDARRFDAIVAQCREPA